MTDCLEAFEQYRAKEFGAYASYPIGACTYFGAGWKARDAEIERLRAALKVAQKYLPHVRPEAPIDGLMAAQRLIASLLGKGAP